MFTRIFRRAFLALAFCTASTVPAESARTGAQPNVGGVAQCGSIDCFPEFILKHGSVIVSVRPRKDDDPDCCPDPE